MRLLVVFAAMLCQLLYRCVGLCLACLGLQRVSEQAGKEASPGSQAASSMHMSSKNDDL